MSEPQTPRDWPRELVLDDEPGPAPYITRAKADALVLGALDQASDTGTDPHAAHSGRRSSTEEPRASTRAAGRSSTPPKPGIGARSLAAAVLLACVSIGSASAAVMWYARRTSEEARAAPVAPARVEPRGRLAEPAAHAPAEVAPRVEAAPGAPSEQAGQVPPRAPEDWLVEGNRLRADKQWSRADHAYGRAAQHAPHSQTAYVARVASAAVRLEHLHDPRGALARYRAALAQSPRGSLGEEIRFGIADALRAIGNRAAEREALLEFLREHPSSALVEQARARLD